MSSTLTDEDGKFTLTDVPVLADVPGEGGRRGAPGVLAGPGRILPLEEVVGKRKTVPLDHPWLESARAVGTNLGD